MTVPDATRHLISDGEQYAHYVEMTWSDASTEFAAQVLDVTDDYSDADSFLQGIKYNGVWVYKVRKDGGVTVRRTVVNVGGSEAALVADTGKVYTNTGIGGPATIDLPGAAAGLTYSLVVMAAESFGFQAAGGDVIRLLCAESAAAGTVLSSQIGDTITLLAVDGTTWVAIAALGTWTVT